MSALVDGLTKLKSRKKKKVKVNLGSKGSFTINHPGVFRAAAQRAGKSTSEFAQEHKGDSGTLGNRARAAIGLMSMKHGKK